MSQKRSRTVGVGTRVTIRKVETDEVLTYTLSRPEKADLEAGIISIACPLARGIEGCKVGDKQAVDLSVGTTIFEILDVDAVK